MKGNTYEKNIYIALITIDPRRTDESESNEGR